MKKKEKKKQNIEVVCNYESVIIMINYEFTITIKEFVISTIGKDIV